MIGRVAQSLKDGRHYGHSADVFNVLLEIEDGLLYFLILVKKELRVSVEGKT